MAVIKCKMCGGDMELSADKSIGTCEYCGSTMTLPKVDDDQRAAAFDRGNHFRRIGEFDKALSVYERIVQEDDGDAEAHWCCALCRFGIEWVKDPASGEYLPTCHRASFDSFLEDVDYQAALAHADVVAKAHYQSEGEKIATVQRGILSISQKEQPFDVFLCYKETDDKGQRTVDSTLAQDIYYQLTEQGRRVFFARITLEDKAGQEYEPYIFAALHSAKVMVVVGTRPEYLNAVWVKNEWSRYLALMKNDRKRLLIPCFRDMDPYDLPEQLSVLQSYDMSKIGFIQDLTRGIAKVLDMDKPKAEAGKESAAVQGETGNLTALLKRGYMALEDGEWNRADEFFEQVLNLDAECAEAYFGKVLAVAQCSNIEVFRQHRMDWHPAEEQLTPWRIEHQKRMDAALEKYRVPGYLEAKEIQKIFGCCDAPLTSTAKGWAALLEREESFWKNDRLMIRALRFASGEFAQQLNGLRDELLAQLRQSLTNAQAKEQADTERGMADFAQAMKQAEEIVIKAHEDAVIRKEADEARSAAAREEAKRQKEEKIRQEQLAAAKRKKVYIALAILIAVGTTAFFLTTKVIIPASKYSAAEKMLEAGDYDSAIEAFTALNEYSDSAEKINSARYAKAESLLEAGDYDGAIEAFTALNGYSDSVERVNSISYSKAERLLAEGNKGGAAKAFGYAGDYQDARKRSLALWDEIIIAHNSIAAGALHTVGLRSDGTVTAVGYNCYGQSDVSGWTNILAVAAGDRYTVGLRSDGSVVATGKNENGRCDVSRWADIVALAVSDYHTVGLRSDGTVVATGRNGDGQCDVNGWTGIKIPG